jgi:His/Glu/Gln/Arg/opine family amino acid ABC transporter permease subunit
VNDFQFGRILAYWPDLLRGVGVTFQLGLISASLGLVLGLALALMKFSRHPFAYWPAYIYVEFFRTTPPLVQIIWLYYGLPLITGYDLGAFGAAAVALGLNIAAFYSEIFRAGLIGVHRTQWQASRVLGRSSSGDPQRSAANGYNYDLPHQGYGAGIGDRYARTSSHRTTDFC